MSASDLPSATTDSREQESSHFIREIITADVAAGRHGGKVVTRFPPEPNGFLHIGHAKSICLNFGMAREFGGFAFLRMDDTNPTTEDEKYVQSIQEAVRWLGFDWGDRMRYASDYFEQLFDWAVQLVKQGDAYVCSLTEAEMREYRGTVMEPGKESPYRKRSVEENLDLLNRMRAGEFPDGAHTLRARIDMANPNMKMRDPPLYRIRRAHHYRRGDAWCIYPLYDYAHCLSDAIEGITHSVCTLEFENNRELYDWTLEKVGFKNPDRPHQFEFARLNLTRTMMSKRKLNALVQDGRVRGWDDPRLPTLLGVRRRGYTAEALRRFCDDIGVSKANSVIEFARLESIVRDDLEARSPRAMAVLKPLRVHITNYAADMDETLDVPSWPEESGRAETRKVPFSHVVYIDREDFAEEPPKGWHRLAPGKEVRLRHAYFITCRDVIKDPDGNVVELRCTYDPETRGGNAPDGRKVRGTLHWVSAKHAIDAEIRLYEDLFTVDRPDEVEEGQDWRAHLNPDSMVTLAAAKLEPSLRDAAVGSHFQFERQGFFVVDPDSKPGALVFNRTVALKDSFVKKPVVEAPARVEKKPAPVTTGPTVDDRVAKLPPAQVEAFAALEKKGLSRDDALVIAQDDGAKKLFDAALATYDAPKSLARWIANDLQRLRKDAAGAELPITPAGVAELAKLVDDGTISGTSAKDVFEEMARTGAAPATIVEAKGLRQVGSADALEPFVDDVLAKNPGEVEKYKAGNRNLVGFFVGLVMKASGGKADAKVVRELLAKKLG